MWIEYVSAANTFRFVLVAWAPSIGTVGLFVGVSNHSSCLSTSCSGFFFLFAN